MTPIARSLAHLRALEYQVAVVEHWIPHTRIRRDLFRMFDLVAIHRAHAGVLGVQVTTASNRAARRKKLRSAPVLRLWLAAGNRAHLHAWGQRRHGRAKLWHVTIEEVFP